MLSFSNEFTLSTVSGEKVRFMSPFLNGDKKIEFRFCSEFNGCRFVLNEERAGIEISNGQQKVLILVDKADKGFLDRCIEMKHAILQDLMDMSERLDGGDEPILIFPTGMEEAPYLITCKTMIDNGVYSVKYEKAIIYCINKAIQKIDKKERQKSTGDTLVMLGGKLKKADLSRFVDGVKEGDDRYSLSVHELAALL